MPGLSAATELLGRHPRVPIALKAALAAALAWLLAGSLGGVADDYPYYAPLGAVVAVSATVVGSARASLQGVLALLIGASLALGTHQLPLPEVVSLALVVALGSLIAGWQWVGEMSSWVPISALFVLVVGQTDPVDYAVGYVGLTGLGAAVGLALNAALPPLPLIQGRLSENTLVEALAGQLDDLADGLRHDPPLTPEEWQERHRPVVPEAERMRRMLTQVVEARRVNWRARRWQQTADRMYDQALAVQRLSLLVEDVSDLVVGHEGAEPDRGVLGPPLRPPAAHALEQMAALLRALSDRGHLETLVPPEDVGRAAAEAVAALGEAVREQRSRTGEDYFAAAAIVSATRRALLAFELDDEPVAAVAG